MHLGRGTRRRERRRASYPAPASHCAPDRPGMRRHRNESSWRDFEAMREDTVHEQPATGRITHCALSPVGLDLPGQCLAGPPSWPGEGPRTMFSLMSCWSFSMTRARVGTGVCRHAGKASLAAPTAASNSSPVVCGSREMTSCVACAAATVHVPQAPACQAPNRWKNASAAAHSAMVRCAVMYFSCSRGMAVKHGWPDGDLSVRMVQGGRAGLVTSIQLLVDDSVNSPLMRFLTVGCTASTEWSWRQGDRTCAMI